MANSKNTTIMAPVAESIQFTILRKNFQPYYEIKSADGHHFFAAMGIQDLHPYLSLHHGPDRNSRTIAMLYMPHASSKFYIGLGDPYAPQSMSWEQLEKSTVRKPEYRWPMTITDGKIWERKTLIWRKTPWLAVGGFKAYRLSRRTFELEDVSKPGEILAAFTSNRSRETCGTLQINRGHGEDFSMMTLVTFLAVYEATRRKHHRTYYSYR